MCILQSITSTYIYWDLAKGVVYTCKQSRPCVFKTVYTLLRSSELNIVTSSFYASYGLLMVCFQILHLCIPMLHLHTWWDLDWFTMALAFNNDHTIYYHIYATWSVELVWTYFGHPHYLVVQC